MLCARADDVALPAAEENARPGADGTEPRIIEQRRKAARRSEVHIPHVRLERPHVGINRAAGTVHRRVVILVAIARVQKLCAGQTRQRDGTVEGPAGVAVRPV